MDANPRSRWRVSFSTHHRPPRIKSGTGFRRDTHCVSQARPEIDQAYSSTMRRWRAATLAPPGTWQRRAGACSGDVDNGSPTRTCATARSLVRRIRAVDPAPPARRRPSAVSSPSSLPARRCRRCGHRRRWRVRPPAPAAWRPGRGRASGAGIMAKLRIEPSGLAMPLPAMSGALPWTGSYKRLRRPSLSARPERGRRQHAERAGHHRRAVGQDVAEQVVGDDHVELPRRAHELHGAVVDIHVRQLDIGIFRVVQRLDVLAPQHAGLQHVGLVDRAHLVRRVARQLEGGARDAADFVGGVDARC